VTRVSYLARNATFCFSRTQHKKGANNEIGMLPGVIDSQQPSNNNGEGEDDGVNGIGDSSQRSEGSDQITLQTVVTSVAIVSVGVKTNLCFKRSEILILGTFWNI